MHDEICRSACSPPGDIVKRRSPCAAARDPVRGTAGSDADHRASGPPRLESLDALRGATIAGMLLVNNPGRWSTSAMYPQLRHAEWHGCTLTDLVFPFFLFIVGVSIVFAFAARQRRGATREAILSHVWRRSLVLYLLGLFQNAFPFLPRGDDGFWPTLAATGVGGWLLRLGLLVCFCAVIALLLSTTRRRRWAFALAAGAAAMLVGSLTAPDGESTWFWSHLGAVRLSGVLPRIAACYLLASALHLYVGRTRMLVGLSCALLIIHTVWMQLVPVPGFGRPDLDVGFRDATGDYTGVLSNWAFYVDSRVLGSHAYHFLGDRSPGTVAWAFDPEGLVGTVTALCTVVLGILAGRWLRRADRSDHRKFGGALAGGVLLIAAGLLASQWIPLNKRLWTSSYVLLTGGLAACCLGICAWLIEIRRHRLWARPLVWYGRNAIFAFFFSSLAATMSVYLRVGPVLQKTRLFETFYLSRFDLRPASLFYALGIVVVWAAIAGLLHRGRLFWKV